jgi:pantothenate kinase
MVTANLRFRPMSDATPPSLSLSPEAARDLLLDRAEALPPGRRLIGIAGGPGTGKSTLAAALVEALNDRSPGTAACVPMDGFHMRHARLEALGAVGDKGMPHTFEGTAFADVLVRLKTATGPLAVPGYSRTIEDVVQDAFIIGAESRLLVVEGNYLLLPDPPWDRVKPLLDLSVFIGVPRDKARERLLRRHAEAGLFTAERNREHVERVDLSNYDRVAFTRPRADLAIDLLTEI